MRWEKLATTTRHSLYVYGNFGEVLPTQLGRDKLQAGRQPCAALFPEQLGPGRLASLHFTGLSLAVNEGMEKKHGNYHGLYRDYYI